jgi:YidC/Oxa1 family membrane protein insertase
MSPAVVLASTIGNIFKPLYEAMAWLLAFFYRIQPNPNYAIAIALLTVFVMVVTAPLTIKSTKSMAAMQRLGPELKKIQQKYKGDRNRLNEEMMKLYKEHGVNPAGGCLPMLLQFPVFIVLYGVIRGLTNTVGPGKPLPYTLTSLGTVTSKPSICRDAVCALPRYISEKALLYHNLVVAHGQMEAFGLNLSEKAIGHHGSVIDALPYFGLVALSIGLQFLQMRQLNSRNPQYAQSNPQAAAMQKYLPFIFGAIYLTIAAGVNIYFIVSSLCRIGIQEGVFRSGVLDKPRRPAEEVLPGRDGSGAKASAPKRRTMMEKLADMQSQALEAKEARDRALKGDLPEVTTGGTPDKGRAPTKGGTPTAGGKRPVSTNGTGGNGNSGSKPSGSSGEQTGTNGTNGASKQPSHPRAKGKRARKAR